MNSTDLLKSHEVILYGPPKASASTMSWSGVTASAENTSSSTIAPGKLVRMNGKTWSLSVFSLKTTVVSSGVSTLSRLYRRLDAPFGSAIFMLRSKENFTSELVRSWPLDHFRPDGSLTVYSLGAVNSADSARSGTTSVEL